MPKQTDANPQRPSSKKGTTTALSDRLLGFIGAIFRPLAFLGSWVPDWLKYHYFENLLPFLRSVVALVFSPFMIAVRAIYFLIYVLGPWWGRPQVRYLMRGLPALFVGICCTWIVINSKLEGGTANRGQKYLKAAQIASAKKEWTKAKIFYQRAIEMGFVSPETQFELAKVAEEANDLPVKVAVMDALAPQDRAVFAPAHLWQAAQFLSQVPLSETSARLGEQQLLFAIQLSPSNEMAHAILGDLYFQRGILDAAAEHLAKAPQELPAYSLKLAKTYLLLGEREKGASCALRTVESARIEIAHSPRQNEIRLYLADALVMLDRFPEAQSVLNDGVSLEPDNKELRTALARLYVAWCHWLKEQNGEMDQIRDVLFQLVSAGLVADPNEPALFELMVEIVAAGGATSQKARESMFDNIANGKAVGLSHLVLGTAYDIEHNSEATIHLKEAFRIMPNAPVVANNLAWHLCSRNPPDLAQAEVIISKTVEQFPDVAAFRDTLATVYFKQGRWSEAIREYNKTFPEFLENPDTHKALSECYEHNGETELSQAHQRKAEALLSSRKQK